MKISLAVLAMSLMVGVTLAANSRPRNIDCSTQSGGQGTLEDHVVAGCTGSTATCCYRLGDNFIFKTLP